MTINKWMKTYFMTAILAVTGSLWADGLITGTDGKTFSRIDFSANLKEVNHDFGSRGKGKFTGMLPEGMVENFTAWTESVVRTTAEKDEAGQFLRFNLEKSNKGSQFYVPLTALQPGNYYRVTVKYRNTTSAPALISIRMVPPPYKTLWSDRLEPATDWQKKELTFQLKEKSEVPVAFFLICQATGALDLAEISITELSAAQAAADIRRPAQDEHNYIHQSRFPLGLPSGWNIDPKFYDGTVTSASAPDVTGPSGSIALKLESVAGKTFGLFSAPFGVANATHANQVSFAIRGQGKWSFAVYGQDVYRPLVEKSITLTGEWQRNSITFTPDPAAKAFSLRIAGSGTLYLDAIRATVGNTPMPYESAGECEVALSLPKSEVDAARIQFENEPAKFLYHVSGNSANAELRLRVVNLYGEAKEMPPLKLTADNLTGNINYPQFAEKPYGQFRLEAAVYRNGKPVSPVNELIVTRLPRPIYWGKDAPESPFGTHALPAGATLAMLKAAGINWVRLHDAGTDFIGWSSLEAEKGKWQFWDDAIMNYRNHHLKILGQLGTAPKWASYLSKVEGGKTPIQYFDRYFRPLDNRDFGNYVSTVTKRYQGVIDEYFIWNEPWMAAFFATGYDSKKSGMGAYLQDKDAAEAFAELTKTAAQAAKSVYPQVKIIGINTATGTKGGQWADNVAAAGGIEPCDAIDFHFYTDQFCAAGNDAVVNAYQEAFGNLIRKNGGKIPRTVYMTEGQGAASEASAQNRQNHYAGMYRYTVPWENKEDYTSFADRNARFLVSMLALNVKRVFLYTAHGYRSLSQPSAFMVLLGGDGYPHPTLAAHAALTSRLEGKPFVRMKQLSPTLYAYFFSNDRESVAAIAGNPTASGTVNCRIGGAKGADLFGNPEKLPITYRGKLFYISAPVKAAELEQAISAE